MNTYPVRKTWLRATRIACVLGAAVVFLSAAVAPCAIQQFQEVTRKIKLSSPPEYPELARRMNIRGVARVLLTVAPDGKVVNVKELGGHPVLLSSLVDAVKKWRYAAADGQSNIEVRFEFK